MKTRVTLKLPRGTRHVGEMPRHGIHMVETLGSDYEPAELIKMMRGFVVEALQAEGLSKIRAWLIARRAEITVENILD
jgi:hypothetical protein